MFCLYVVYSLDLAVEKFGEIVDGRELVLDEEKEYDKLCTIMGYKETQKCNDICTDPQIWI